MPAARGAPLPGGPAARPNEAPSTWQLEVPVCDFSACVSQTVSLLLLNCQAESFRKVWRLVLRPWEASSISPTVRELQGCYLRSRSSRAKQGDEVSSRKTGRLPHRPKSLSVQGNQRKPIRAECSRFGFSRQGDMMSHGTISTVLGPAACNRQDFSGNHGAVPLYTAPPDKPLKGG